MTRKQMYNYMGYPHKLPSCSGKARYSSEAEAVAAMLDHQRKIVCDGMDVYWCWMHQCWHKGHTDKRWWNNRQLEESVAFFERVKPHRVQVSSLSRQ